MTADEPKCNCGEANFTEPAHMLGCPLRPLGGLARAACCYCGSRSVEADFGVLAWFKCNECGSAGPKCKTLEEAARRWDAAFVRQSLRHAYERGVEAAAVLVSRHSCVSTCCDAQPSSGEAAELARCIRKNLVGPQGGAS